LAPDTVLPQLKRRLSKSDYSDEDVEAWTPGTLGERSVTDKRLRKTARAAQTTAGHAIAAADHAAGPVATPVAMPSADEPSAESL
jgi:tRNA (adenine57-N1/adenine58-N1)-methyltransferase